MSNKNQIKRQQRLDRQRNPGQRIERNGVVLQRGSEEPRKHRGSAGVSPRYDGYTEEEMLRAIGIATAVRNANARLEPKQYALPLAGNKGVMVAPKPAAVTP